MTKQTKQVELILGDCLEKMRDIPDGSVDAIITDPPYNIKKSDWDKWKTKESYINWCSKWILECQRVLKDNGSFYFFHNDMPQIAMLMEWIRQNTRFIFKQFIVWNKRFKGMEWIDTNNRKRTYKDYSAILTNDSLRNYKKMAEYCLFYTFQDETGLTQIYGNDTCFKPIRDYLKQEKIKAKLKTCKQINQLLGVNDTGGGMASHYFSDKVGFKQWALPTKEMYQKLQTTGCFQREYEDLRREYEDLRREYEGLRYTFNNQKTNHSVWNYEIAKKEGHITPKPVDLIENIIKHSSNEGDTILDPFMGSGTTGVACKNLNRNFIGIELDPTYFEIAKSRINTTQEMML